MKPNSSTFPWFKKILLNKIALFCLHFFKTKIACIKSIINYQLTNYQLFKIWHVEVAEQHQADVRATAVVPAEAATG
jgi:hypothetical protein